MADEIVQRPGFDAGRVVDELDTLPCDRCGKETPLELLDCKPVGWTVNGIWKTPRFWTLEMLQHAAEIGLPFDQLECGRCYGPNFVAGMGTVTEERDG